ncbi:MAG: stage III sporulation AC/AD family protein [Clostridia bacterium]|nr:stage III sporulation AC/AD family protein [Clostridia bacterium]
MNIFSVIIVSIIVSVLAIFIKQNNPAYSVLLIIIFVIIMITVGINYLFDLTGRITESVGGIKYAPEFLKILLKAIIICILSDLSSTICKDSGNGSVAVCIDVVTRIILLSLTLPIVEKLVEVIQGLFNL